MRAAGVIAALVAAPAALAHADSPSMIGDDVAPSMTVVERDGTSLTLGGLLQMHVAPYVGADSLLADGDPASRAGLRMRRARFGAEAVLPQHVEVLLVMSPLESDADTGSIADARISYTRHRAARISIGADKVPFTRGELQSSAALASIERPLAVVQFVPQRRLGITVEGTVAGDKLAYLAGVMNATEGYELGNQYAGLLYVGRVELAPLRGRPAEDFELDDDGGGDLELVVGAGGYAEDGAASRVFAASVDLQLTVAGAALRLEALCVRRVPLDAPEQASPGLPDDIDRCGAYAEASYAVAAGGVAIEPAARVEWIDDNLDLDDAGDGWLVSAGANSAVTPHLRAQLHYLGRYERHSQERANDAVILSVQGQF